MRPELLAAFGRATAGAPDELTLSVAFLTLPDLDVVPAPVRGRFVAHLRVAFLGDPHTAEALLAPLHAVAEPVLDTVRPLTIEEIGTIHSDPVRPQPVSCGSAVVPAWSDGAIAVLLDEIGPAVLLAHSAGGGSTFRVPDLNPSKVVGIIGFETAGSNPTQPGFNNGPALITSWKSEPVLPATFAAVDKNGCSMQGDRPSKLVNYANLPIVLVSTEKGLMNKAAIECAVSVWTQACAKGSAVYFPDRGLKGGGHFAMAQLDSADYAKVLLELAAGVESAAKK